MILINYNDTDDNLVRNRVEISLLFLNYCHLLKKLLFTLISLDNYVQRVWLRSRKALARNGAPVAVGFFHPYWYLLFFQSLQYFKVGFFISVTVAAVASVYCGKLLHGRRCFFFPRLRIFKQF